MPAGYKEDGTYDMRTKAGRELATRDRMDEVRGNNYNGNVTNNYGGNNVNSTMQGGDDACCIIS